VTSGCHQRFSSSELAYRSSRLNSRLFAHFYVAFIVKVHQSVPWKLPLTVCLFDLLYSFPEKGSDYLCQFCLFSAVTQKLFLQIEFWKHKPSKVLHWRRQALEIRLEKLYACKCDSFLS
jgi:hypothetical protein